MPQPQWRISTSRATRFGTWAAISVAIMPPNECPTITASSMPSSSSSVSNQRQIVHVAQLCRVGDIGIAGLTGAVTA